MHEFQYAQGGFSIRSYPVNKIVHKLGRKNSLAFSA